jgi:ATP-binding cassette subfamily B protein
MILIGAFYFQKRATPLYAEVRERVGLLGARLSSSISGIATIKSFTAENYELTHLQAESNEYVAANRRAIAVSSAFNPLIRLAVMVGFISALVFGGYLTVRGSLQVGSYSILIFLTQRLLWPLTGLAQTVDLFERAMASTSRVLNLIETPVRILSTTTDESQAAVRGEIRLEQVSFAYANHIPILRDVSLSIAAGETVAFVGATGSGKSTLAKLLLRFYEPQQGRITLDGRDLEKWNLAELRRNIGFVSQDVFLFQGTIRDNIRYGSFQASDDEVIRCAQQAEADEFIRALPAGYDTRVGERGVKLSGGQRQRLSIARALLKNPPILIFDEATSSVDNETEAAIQRSLDQISVGRTTLMIAHRLSTISKASSIFVLDRGQVVQHGRHRDLVNQPGIYANLWRVQAGLNAPLASESHV